MCPYAHYELKQGDKREYIYCEKINDKCGYSRMCTKVNRIIPNRMEVCALAKEKIIPKGTSRVRFEKRGVLFVEIGECVYEIKNPYDYVPDYVNVVKVDEFWYIKGFEPQKEVITEEVEVKSTKKSNKQKEVII